MFSHTLQARVNVQLCGKQPAHLDQMLVVTVDVVVALVPAVFPLTGADGRRPRPVAADGRGQGHGLHPGVTSQSGLSWEVREGGREVGREGGREGGW